MKKLLLISSSKTHGTGFLEHARVAVEQHLQGIRCVTFVPYALANRDAYARLAEKTFGEFGFSMNSLHQTDDPVSMVRQAEAIFTGGGNTFRLLKTLADLGLLEPIREKISGGMPYMGSSAGTNITCPTIRTTNDMPIVQPPDFNALNLIPFQINPHYLDPPSDSTHQGESRETRLAEYLEENKTPVLGIREGCWLKIEGDQGTVQGTRGARLFRRGTKPTELKTGDSISELLALGSS